MGRPFLATRRTLIDVAAGELIMRVNDEQVVFNIFKAMKYPVETDDCFAVSQVDQAIAEFQKRDQFMTLSIYKKLGLGEVQPTTVKLQLADRTYIL